MQKVKLGEGAFGTVWRGVDKSNDEPVAIKQLNIYHEQGRSVKNYEHEVSIMRMINHPNVLRVRDAYQEQRSVLLVLDYMDGGDLGDKMKESALQAKEMAAYWMYQVCAAIQAMHTAGLIHRDVKPDNFMIANGILKLSDFGLAMAVPQNGRMGQKCGTPAFMAPEQHELPHQRGYGPPVDAWAAGVILYMLLNGGQHPFLQGNQMNMDNLLNGRVPKKGKISCLSPVGGGKGTKEGEGLVTSLLMRDENKRLKPSEALKHPFLSGQAHKAAKF